MEFKRFINKVKDEHNNIKNKQSNAKNPLQSKSGPLQNTDHFQVKTRRGLRHSDGDIFAEKIENSLDIDYRDYTIKEGDTLKSISREFYEDEQYWIMLHRANYHKIPNPFRLFPGIILDIPQIGEYDNFYPRCSKNGNYIIQADDDLFSIARNIFGTKKLAQKLIDWNFLKQKNDIYPGREIPGLPFLDFCRQVSSLAAKLNIEISEEQAQELKIQQDIILAAICTFARQYQVPPIVAMSVSFTEHHWMNIQGRSFEEEINYKQPLKWEPMLINEDAYPEAFPEAALNLEKNIAYGLQFLKALRKETKNWPKAIAAYVINSPPGKGKPQEQKQKAEICIDFVDDTLQRMSDPDFEQLIKSKLSHEDQLDISFELLFKELVDYRNWLNRKYL